MRMVAWIPRPPGWTVTQLSQKISWFAMAADLAKACTLSRLAVFPSDLEIADLNEDHPPP